MAGMERGSAAGGAPDGPGERAALVEKVADLMRRGLLDDTLVIWAGEFGRTVYSQGGLSQENYGRDHHPRCFTTWMTGGGVRREAGVPRSAIGVS